MENVAGDTPIRTAIACSYCARATPTSVADAIADSSCDSARATSASESTPFLQFPPVPAQHARALGEPSEVFVVVTIVVVGGLKRRQGAIEDIARHHLDRIQQPLGTGVQPHHLASDQILQARHGLLGLPLLDQNLIQLLFQFLELVAALHPAGFVAG